MPPRKHRGLRKRRYVESGSAHGLKICHMFTVNDNKVIVERDPGDWIACWSGMVGDSPG